MAAGATWDLQSRQCSSVHVLVSDVCWWRVQRDIPMPLVSSGVEKGNLRELALARMGDLGLQCRDVRTREAGIQDIHHKVLHCMHSYTRCLKTVSDTRWNEP